MASLLSQSQILKESKGNSSEIGDIFAFDQLLLNIVQFTDSELRRPTQGTCSHSIRVSRQDLRWYARCDRNELIP